MLACCVVEIIQSYLSLEDAGIIGEHVHRTVRILGSGTVLFLSSTHSHQVLLSMI